MSASLTFVDSLFDNCNPCIIVDVATIHISEADAARDFASLLARARRCRDHHRVRCCAGGCSADPGAPPRRSIEECIALLPEDYTPTVDEDFARDIQEAVATHREPLNPPTWD
jgi:hypothetical protein